MLAHVVPSVHLPHTSTAKVFRFPASTPYPSRYLAFALLRPAWVPSRRLTISLTFVETACEADRSSEVSYVPESVVIAAFVAESSAASSTAKRRILRPAGVGGGREKSQSRSAGFLHGTRDRSGRDAGGG